MKRFLLTLLSLTTVFVFSISFAHSGGTDSQGGHYNHSTGEYHFHHGYHAHQHPNGVCPYDTPSRSSSSYTTMPTPKPTEDWFAEWQRTHSTPVPTATPFPNPFRHESKGAPMTLGSKIFLGVYLAFMFLPKLMFGLLAKIIGLFKFQSTLPVRGATVKTRIIIRIFK